MTDFSDAVVTKARQIVNAGGVKQLAGDNWEVTSTSGSKYVVLVTHGVGTCSCPSGAHRIRAICSHVAAVLQVLEVAQSNTSWGDLSVDHFAVELRALRKLGHR